MLKISKLEKQQGQYKWQKVDKRSRTRERDSNADFEKIWADAYWKRKTLYPLAKESANPSATKFPPPHASRIAAAFEAARIVVAWALGRKFGVAVINRMTDSDGKQVPCSYITFDAGPANAAARRYFVGCAFHYAGSAVYARKSHAAFKCVLATYGKLDSASNEWLFFFLPAELVREEIESRALATVRAICTKYMVLLNAVEAILLANNEIKWSEFSKLLEANGLHVKGDEIYAAVQ